MLSQGSSGMKQQNAALPADGRSGVRSGHIPVAAAAAGVALPPGSLSFACKGTASASIRLAPLLLFAPDSLEMRR